MKKNIIALLAVIAIAGCKTDPQLVKDDATGHNPYFAHGGWDNKGTIQFNPAVPAYRTREMHESVSYDIRTGEFVQSYTY